MRGEAGEGWRQRTRERERRAAHAQGHVNRAEIRTITWPHTSVTPGNTSSWSVPCSLTPDLRHLDQTHHLHTFFKPKPAVVISPCSSTRRRHFCAPSRPARIPHERMSSLSTGLMSIRHLLFIPFYFAYHPLKSTLKQNL